jgi:uncharacterized repeat protein (TIGR01451 family)
MKTLLSMAVLTAISSGVSAAPIGTPAATAIDNTASISYSVGTTPQTAIESSDTGNSTPGAGNGTATTFVVDKKVDLSVTGATTTNVVPSQTGAVDNTELTYTLTNEGNSTEDFTLTPSDSLAVGVGDEFNSTGCTVTSPALPVTLASGDSTPVTVECDIPASSVTVTNGAQSLVDLLAEATGVTASSGADTAGCISGTVAGGDCVVDVVFADGSGTGTDTGGSTGGGAGDRNAKHSATSTYVINTADLIVQKTQALTAMNIDLNGDGDVTDPGESNATGYHIPGSTVEYTITVANAAGAATATGINIGDTVPATMTVVGTPSLDVAGNAGTANAAGNVVSTTPFDLAAGETATLTIVATVN